MSNERGAGFPAPEGRKTVATAVRPWSRIVRLVSRGAAKDSYGPTGPDSLSEANPRPCGRGYSLTALRAWTLILVMIAPLHAQTVSQQQVQATVKQYCVTCHNQRAKTGNLDLETRDLARLETDAVVWESVVRKLRTGMMPPKGAPRPERNVLESAASWLETGLDRAAAARPNPGSPSLHRMNRNEYANAIRDLLDLQVDVTTLLPGDSTTAGFDNIADVLGTSPALIQGYLSAAMKISRLAVGDLSAPPAPVTYRAARGLSQRSHLDGLPLGTQGGMVARHNFPLDGEYEIRVPGGARLDLTIDGEPVATGGRGSFRLAIPAGPHTIGTAAVRATDAAEMDDIFSAPPRGGGGITNITVTGPFQPAGRGDTPSRRRIFVCAPRSAAEELPCARQILKTLATRAFRQPVKDDDSSMETLLGFYQEARAGGDFETGIQRALARILVDPRFVFRIEHVPARLAEGTAYRLTDLELATRLSFFLWSSIPDDTLLNLAIAGRLSNPAVLEEQTRRMLADPKSRALIDNFATEWMRLRELENAQPESSDFDGNLRLAFQRETQLFFESILKEDRSIVDLIDADYTFVDERLARHYGIPNVKGSLFRRVTLPADNPRRGILGKGSVLLVTSVANRTSPVARGQWVLENLLGSRAPNPPPGVETNLDQEADASKAKSLRERMEMHRANAVCASCHNIMDPVGFSLENFDLVGKWREFDGKTRIDATAEMVDGTRLDGPAPLRRALLDRSQAFVTVATEKLLTYAAGRPVAALDMPAVRTIVRDSARNNYRFSSLVLGVVKSQPFQMRTKVTK
jgi:mono/diheme cytochrome c family protein/cytochrome c553